MADGRVVVENLRKTYPGDVVAVDGISFEVKAGSVFGFVGPNGAGKSTTIRILTTLALPSSGEATVGGFDVLRQPHAVRQDRAHLRQTPGASPALHGPLYRAVSTQRGVR